MRLSAMIVGAAFLLLVGLLVLSYCLGAVDVVLR